MAVERRLEDKSLDESFCEKSMNRRRSYRPPVGAPTESQRLRSKIDKSALLMLSYPAVYLVVILPLSIFRLAALGGVYWSSDALAACGTIFALGGLTNAILYSVSRVRIHQR